MALAPLGHLLFTRFMRHDPPDPTWPDRDRFVLSAGHASMLLYALLHLCGTTCRSRSSDDSASWDPAVPVIPNGVSPRA